MDYWDGKEEQHEGAAGYLTSHDVVDFFLSKKIEAWTGCHYQQY